MHLALSVGIFPYVLRLLQATSDDLRPYLVFIWAKILAVDRVRRRALPHSRMLIRFFLGLSNRYHP